MRSSFNTATIIKQVACSFIASSVTCLSQAALAAPSNSTHPGSAGILPASNLVRPGSAGTLPASSLTRHPEGTYRTPQTGVPQYLIAQGDASLPPPDPSYRARIRAQNANRNQEVPSDSSQITPGGSDQSAGTDDGAMRRKWRKRLNGQGAGAGFKGAGLDSPGGAPGGGPGNGPAGLGGGRFGGRMGLRQGDGGALSGGIRRQVDGGALGAGGPIGGGGALGAGGGARRGFQNTLSGGNMFGKRPLDLTSLGLTPEQKQRIQGMREQLGPKTRELRKTLNAKRMELRDMMFEASAGDDQVRAKRKEVRQLQDKVEEMQINDFLAIRSVLTPDQRQKLTDLKPAGGTKFAAGGAPTQLVAPVVTQP